MRVSGYFWASGRGASSTFSAPHGQVRAGTSFLTACGVSASASEACTHPTSAVPPASPAMNNVGSWKTPGRAAGRGEHRGPGLGTTAKGAPGHWVPKSRPRRGTVPAAEGKVKGAIPPTGSLLAPCGGLFGQTCPPLTWGQGGARATCALPRGGRRRRVRRSAPGDRHSLFLSSSSPPLIGDVGSKAHSGRSKRSQPNAARPFAPPRGRQGSCPARCRRGTHPAVLLSLIRENR
jgi:hypothetical protein